jgi:dihydrofolate reductase
MRELILKMSISIDGFVGASDGGIRWVFDSRCPEGMAWTVAKISNASLHIMGSRTFHDMASWWPASTDVFAAPMNQIPKAVFTRKDPAILTAANPTNALRDARADAGPDAPKVLQPGAESWAEAYVASGDLAEEIKRLKAQDGKPIVAHGGAGFARSLVATGLIDQYALNIHPVSLGQGLAIFSGLNQPQPLKLVESKTFPTGVTAQVYRPA